MAYFYFDFRDTEKQHLHGLLSSLLSQLGTGSDSRHEILFRLYSAHANGTRKPTTRELTHCLKDMLTLPGQGPTYLIVDALDECPNSTGMPSPRERVLGLIEEFVELHLPNLHICVSSRSEIDIRYVLEPLTSLHVSLHDETGQKEDVTEYINSVCCPVRPKNAKVARGGSENCH